MPVRPFPFPLGVGTDICRIDRIQRLIRPKPTRAPDESGAADAARADRSRLRQFLHRVLTPAEQTLFWARMRRRARPSTGTAAAEAVSGRRIDLAAAAEYLAGRWAAKEAVIKAVSSARQISFHEVQIWPRAGPRKGVYAVILDRGFESTAVASWGGEDTTTTTTEADASERGEDQGGSSSDRAEDDDLTSHLQDVDGQIAEISISHDGEYAVATCIAPLDSRTGDVGGEAAAREP